MKKKVPKAAAVAPRPHEQQHAAISMLQNSFRERCAAHLLSAVKEHVSTGSKKRLNREKWLRTWASMNAKTDG
jgi:hypothetical protein